MARVALSPSASADQADILNELYSKAGMATAFKFRSLFRATYDRLANYLASGPRRPALGPDTRIAIVALYTRRPSK